MDDRDPFITDAEARGDRLREDLEAIGRSPLWGAAAERAKLSPGIAHMFTAPSARREGCYEPARLQLLAIAENFTFWRYLDLDDRLSTILSLGYFAGSKMHQGDMVVLNARDGTTLAVALKHGDDLMLTSITGTAR